MERNIALKFYADWCEPCKTYAPIVDSVFFARPDISLRAINVDQDPKTAFEYGVSTIPFIVFLKGENVVGKVNGVQTMQGLKSKVIEVFGDTP